MKHIEGSEIRGLLFFHWNRYRASREHEFLHTVSTMCFSLDFLRAFWRQNGNSISMSIDIVTFLHQLSKGVLLHPSCNEYPV